MTLFHLFGKQLVWKIMITGCDGEGSCNSHYTIHISISVVRKTRASGEMVSEKMVRGAKG